MEKTKIILDFDNTIAQSAETILKMHGYDCDPKKLGWDFSPYAKDLDEKMVLVDEFNNPVFWDNLKPMNGFRGWIEKQHVEGLDIYVCSKRMPGQFTNLIDWMKKYDFDKYIKDYIFIHKSYITKTLLLDDEAIIVDDNPKCFGDDDHSLKVRFGKYAYGDAYKNYNLHYSKWSNMPLFKRTKLQIKFLSFFYERVSTIGLNDN